MAHKEKNWWHELISFSDGIHLLLSWFDIRWTIDLATGMVVFSQFHLSTGTRTDGLDCAFCLALPSENRPTSLAICFLFVAFVKADAAIESISDLCMTGAICSNHAIVG